MRCTEVLRRANVSEIKILIETVVLEKNQIDQELDSVTFYMLFLKRRQRPIPQYKDGAKNTPGW
jgi:hypothetical protein